MKNNKIVSEVKKAGIVATAVLTFNACGNKQLSQSQLQTAQHKADSALTINPQYRMAKATLDLLDLKIDSYRKANKTLIRIYARDYIKNHVADMVLSKFMVDAIDSEFFVSDNDSIESDVISIDAPVSMNYIRRNQRWFNDVLMYLTGKYSERQLLNSEFFDVINNPALKRKFECNTEKIERLISSKEFPEQCKEIIQKDILNKYKDEVKKQR